MASRAIAQRAPTIQRASAKSRASRGCGASATAGRDLTQAPSAADPLTRSMPARTDMGGDYRSRPGRRSVDSRVGRGSAGAGAMGKELASDSSPPTGFYAACGSVHRAGLQADGRPWRIRIMASVFTLPTRRAARPGSPTRAAFSRVFNLRNIAALFYFCLLLIVGRFVVWFGYDPIDSWAFDLVRGLRQTMISAVVMLLAIACVEAFMSARRLSPRRA